VSACFSAFPPWLALEGRCSPCERLAADLPRPYSATCTRNVWSRRHYNSPFSQRPGQRFRCAERFGTRPRRISRRALRCRARSQEASRGSRGRPIADIRRLSRARLTESPEVGRGGLLRSCRRRYASRSGRNEAAPWKQRARRSRAVTRTGAATGAASRRSVCLQSSAVDPAIHARCVRAASLRPAQFAARGVDTYLIGERGSSGEPGPVR